MCGRYYNRTEKQEIARRFRASKVFAEPYPPNYNIAPTTFQPIVRQQRDTDDRELVLARWGLVPFFAKSLADFRGFSTFNARAEGIQKAPTWRGPFQSRRCIVPADGFYEWKALGAAKKAARQPYSITLRSGEPFALAGVWDAWHDKNANAWLQSFAIVTTEANELVSTLHTRMPVILHPRDWERWLSRGETAQLPLDLLRPFESDPMQAAPCNPAAGNVRNNGPELLICPPPNPDPPLNSA